MALKRVVVTGLGALTPIGNNIGDYWQGLTSGKSGSAPITYFNTEKFKTLAILYKKVATEINWPSENELISLSHKHLSLLKDSYNRLIHRLDLPRLKTTAVNNSLNVEKITTNYFDHEFG